MSESDKVAFPEWEGYKDLEGVKQVISYGSYNDPNLILEYAAKMSIERTYFKDLLLFIQNRIQKYFDEGGGLGLGIDSSREIFEGLMIVPAEDVSFPSEYVDRHEQFIEDTKSVDTTFKGGDKNGRDA